MADEKPWSTPGGEDTMLREAIEALRKGDRATARDLLTRLLKVNQKNAKYWVWLSAAVETRKERIYCLEKAHQADPNNMAAKRGLTFFGVLPLDDSVKPFKPAHPRMWEEKLRGNLEEKKEVPFWSQSLGRAVALLGIGLLVIAGLFLGRAVLTSIQASQVRLVTPTHRPTFTLTFTPSPTPLFRTPTPTFLGPTPLWMFLTTTYTPTPLYVLTQHPVINRSAYETGLRFLALKKYDSALVLFQQAITLEKNAPDLYYYAGETYRVKGETRSALEYYQKAIEQDARFAPAYLGRARANLALDPQADVRADLNQAIQLDAGFAEAYLARSDYLLNRDSAQAREDAEAALEITPNSALAYVALAQVELNVGNAGAALIAATRANQLDMTLVPVYFVLGKAYLGTGEYAQAISTLKTYLVFVPEDVNAMLDLGTALNNLGDYEAALPVLDKVIEENARDAEARFQRGYSYLNLNQPKEAETDFNAALSRNPQDFDANLALGRVYFLQGKSGNAYVQVKNKAQPLAGSDATLAQVYYWEAIFQEAIGDAASLEGALENWEKLLALPAEAVPPAWREQALQQLKITPTPAASPVQTTLVTPTRSPTPKTTP